MGALCGAHLTFLLYKGVKLVIKEEKLKRNHMKKKSGEANLLINLPTFNYLGSKNFLIMNDGIKESWRLIT